MKIHPDFQDVPDIDLPITPEELKDTFVFTPDHKLESWATWHRDQDINREQAGKLAQNLIQKREELIQASVANHLGHLPREKTLIENVSVVQVEHPKQNIYHLYYRKTHIAAWTEPQSRIQGVRYYLTWYFRDLAYERKLN